MVKLFPSRFRNNMNIHERVSQFLSCSHANKGIEIKLKPKNYFRRQKERLIIFQFLFSGPYACEIIIGNGFGSRGLTVNNQYLFVSVLLHFHCRWKSGCKGVLLQVPFPSALPHAAIEKPLYFLCFIAFWMRATGRCELCRIFSNKPIGCLMLYHKIYNRVNNAGFTLLYKLMAIAVPEMTSHNSLKYP